MSINQVVKICQQLKSEGKEPTTALVKARMPAPKSLPLIIAGLKHWKSNPDQKVEDEVEEAPVTKDKTLEQRVDELEKLVVELNQRIAVLESK